ncbi:MAG: outer membrane protein OmpA [Sphingobacteriales bacterium]|nr:outer membrane protein OmpA [Sphingobacteriales bacterium]
MIPINKTLQKFVACSMFAVFAISTVTAQTTQPTWWFGVSGAANFNSYTGTTQRLNNSLIVPAAFHKGNGVRPFGSILMEYRPSKILGFSLNVGYDGRGGKMDSVVAACNCPATLKTNISYVTVEPSLRLNVASSNFYLFAGPRIGFNLKKDFAYTQLKQPNTDGELSAMRKTVISGQIGAGYDIPMSAATSSTKVVLSPFVSFHPYFGQDPRTIESLSLTTVRAGVALKFGKAGKASTVVNDVVVPAGDVVFSVRAPKTVPVTRQVSETLPLRNSVFFDEGSSTIPTRYITLTSAQASEFKEEQLQNEQSVNMAGRSGRQLNVYHNVLNILGDRMRANPGASLALSGASGKGAKDGKVCAESVKQYMVTAFGIDASRITTQGRVKPLIPSEQPGGTKELVLLRQGDRRVDIQSASPELLMEVGGDMMKPIVIKATQVDPLDSHIIMNVVGAKKLFKSWSVDMKDDKGIVQHYGPYTNEKATLPGNSVLGTSPEGDYQIVMTGLTKEGLTVTKKSTVHLMRPTDVSEKGYRYSILFDFDKSKSIASYEKFLVDVVSPLISDGSTVIIHGHTDIIGNEDYNQTLSQNRAQQAQKVLENALTAAGKTNVKFESFGFGEDITHSPFDNSLPEERFYNRTVIIDIVSVK